jgi:hypothetical protein
MYPKQKIPAALAAYGHDAAGMRKHAPRLLHSSRCLVSGEFCRGDGKAILVNVENAKRSLDFSTIAYVLVSRQTAIAASRGDILQNPGAGRHFPGG